MYGLKGKQTCGYGFYGYIYVYIEYIGSLDIASRFIPGSGIYTSRFVPTPSVHGSTSLLAISRSYFSIFLAFTASLFLSLCRMFQAFTRISFVQRATSDLLKSLPCNRDSVMSDKSRRAFNTLYVYYTEPIDHFEHARLPLSTQFTPKEAHKI